MGLIEATRCESFEEEKEFRFGDDSVSLKIESLEILSGLLFSKSSGLIELNVELIEESMELADIERTTAIVVINIKGLIDEHLKSTVVESVQHDCNK